MRAWKASNGWRTEVGAGGVEVQHAADVALRQVRPAGVVVPAERGAAVAAAAQPRQQAGELDEQRRVGAAHAQRLRRLAHAVCAGRMCTRARQGKKHDTSA